MNTKELIETFGNEIKSNPNNINKVIEVLQEDFVKLLRERHVLTTRDISSVFNEINGRFISFINKIKSPIDKELFLKSFPNSLNNIINFSRDSKDQTLAIHSNTVLPERRVPITVNMSTEVSNFLMYMYKIND